MLEKAIDLTLVDKEILNSYIVTIQGMADYFGKSYELVLHSLESFENSVIFIVNGEHTGRKIGAPITNMALKMLDQLNGTSNDSVVYFTKNKFNEPLKSTTIAIRGEKSRIIGLLCINMYLNTPINQFIEELHSKGAQTTSEITNESFAEKSDELIKTTLSEVVEAINNDHTIKPSNKNKEIIAKMQSMGIFKIKNSVQEVADELNISKNTVYLHLRNCKQQS